MATLIIDAAVRDQVARLVTYASEHPISRRQLADMAERVKNRAVGDRPEYEVNIPVGFRCVFSIEDHPGGWMRHLSVSVNTGKAPHPMAVVGLMSLFGFSQPFVEQLTRVARGQTPAGPPIEAKIYMEDHDVVNVMERLHD